MARIPVWNPSRRLTRWDSLSVYSWSDSQANWSSGRSTLGGSPPPESTCALSRCSSVATWLNHQVAYCCPTSNGVWNPVVVQISLGRGT